MTGVTRKGEGMKTMVQRVSLKDLIAAGVIKAPAPLAKTYRGKRVTARIEPDGTVTFQGKSYRSLSTAGGAARAAVQGSKKLPATNGWDFWQIGEREGGAVAVGKLRERVGKGR